MTLTAPAVNSPVIDCHAHIFDTARYPFHASGTYAVLPNEHGDAIQYAAVLDSHGVQNAVLINPLGGYGLDNHYMLEAIRASRGRFKGVAVVPTDLGEAQARQLAAEGVVSVRFSLHHPAGPSLYDSATPRLLTLCESLGWSVLIHYTGDLIADAMPILDACPAQIVVDHCGRPELANGIRQKGFAALLELGRSGRAVIKLSGVFRFTREPWPHADVEPYVEALVAAFGVERCIWGSDWPFTRMDRRVNYGPLLALAARWFPDLAARRAVLHDNAARLFGFPRHP